MIVAKDLSSAFDYGHIFINTTLFSYLLILDYSNRKLPAILGIFMSTFVLFLYKSDKNICGFGNI